MQNKGFIRVFAILLVLAGLYSLSFTYYTYKADRDADAYAKNDFTKRKQFMDSIESMPDYYNFLGLRDFSLRDCREKELNLGLDLKGGMNVTLQISIEDMIVNLSDLGLQDTMLKATIDKTAELETQSGDAYVTLFGRAFDELYPNQHMRLMFLGNEDIKEKVNYKSTNEEVLAFLEGEAKAAFDNSFNIIRTRIDRFGVNQPNIQNIGNGRILVELPGVKDPERVRDLLESSAHLEFWETYNCGEVVGVLYQINAALAAKNKLEEEELSSKQTVDSTVIAKTAAVDSSKTELSALEKLEKDTLKIAEEANEVSREAFLKENPLFGRMGVNVSKQGQPGLGPVLGFAKIDDLNVIDSLLKLPEAQEILIENTPELKFAWSKKATETGVYQLIALKDRNNDGKPSIDGKVVTDANTQFQQGQASASVQMKMNPEGARGWKLLTKELVSNPDVKYSVAIVLDGNAISWPTVQSEIADGISSITGDFTIDEANDLANILKSGKLSAKAEILNAEFVGPSLGQESIEKGLFSFFIAFLFILLYMLFYYQKAGLIANLALLLNLFLIFGVLASLGAALTLPGIAGLVLTIGMSVDANVLIFERIREEMAQGKGIKLAIQDGYKHAYSAIVDANVTTIIIGIILYIFGSGPIQGFATTLIIGILTSLFSAIFITRLTFERLLNRKSNITFDTKLTRNAFKKVNLAFIENRKKFYVISILIIGVGIASMVTRQWNLGVDFSGGRSYIIQVEGERNTNEIQESLKNVFGEAPEVKTYGDEELKITTDYMINKKGSEVDSIVEAKLFEGLQPILSADTDFDTFMDVNMRQSDMVGPTIADDIIWGAVISLTLALLFIFIYIFVRFRNWQYGLGAVAALFHDVLIVLGIFSLLWGFVPFSLEIGQSFIAALLTVIGYSINDTVIVFDRVREITVEYPKRPTIQLFNQALNSTISRTVNTSLTTILVLLAIFVFGGDSIRGFVFAMMIGVIVGTYSSLFIASPISFDFLKKQKRIIE